MAENNIAAVLHKTHDIRFGKKRIPQPGKNEIQIRIRYVGVCGSDTHLWHEGRVGDIIVAEAPFIQGHECSGVVSMVGDSVTNLKVGDRVAIEPQRNCRTCEYCTSGRYNLCENLYFFSMPPNDGALVQYIVHSAHFATKLNSDNMSLEEAALVEPLSVGLYACRRAGVCLGDTVLISGVGPIGMCALLAAQACGVTRIIVTDLLQARLDLAKTLGATHTVLIDEDRKPEDVAKAITDKLKGAPDKVIDCSGAEHAIHVDVHAIKPGGVICLVGIGETNMTVPWVRIITKELQINASMLYTRTWPSAIDMISSGRCNVAPLVSHRYTLQETKEAFEMAHSRKCMKVMIDCNPE